MPEWAEAQGFADNEEALAGARIFAQAGCGQCHVSRHGRVQPRCAGPLRRRRVGHGAEYFAGYVTNPAQFGNNVMPPYAGLGEENLQQLGAFLDASKGSQE